MAALKTTADACLHMPILQTHFQFLWLSCRTTQYLIKGPSLGDDIRAKGFHQTDNGSFARPRRYTSTLIITVKVANRGTESVSYSSLSRFPAEVGREFLRPCQLLYHIRIILNSQHLGRIYERGSAAESDDSLQKYSPTNNSVPILCSAATPISASKLLQVVTEGGNLTRGLALVALMDE